MSVLGGESVYLFMDIPDLETATITVKAVPGEELNNGKCLHTQASAGPFIGSMQDNACAHSANMSVLTDLLLANRQNV